MDQESSFFQILTAHDFNQRLQLPPDFVQIHQHFLFERCKLKSISSQHSWDVIIKLETRAQAKPCYFTNGWTHFATDFMLQLGDCVVFWYHALDATFDVAVYKADGSEKKILDCDSSVKSEPLDEDDNDLETKDVRGEDEHEDSETDGTESDAESGAGAKDANSSFPQFELHLTASRAVHVSMPFAKKTGLVNAQSVTLEYPPRERYWSVVLNHYHHSQSCTRVDFGAGWSKFREENGLEMGSTYSLVFNEAKNVIQVRKKRKSPIVKMPAGSVHKPSSSSKRKRPCKRTSMAYKRAKAFMEDNRTGQHLSFVCYISSSYKNYSLTLPEPIIRCNHQQGFHAINLCDSSGEIWPVNMSYQKRYARITCGWKTFVTRNDINIGDACLFQWNRRDPLTWKFMIFRN